MRLRSLAFDYDGKHLVFGNSGGESDHSHVDFPIFEIDYFGPDTGPKQVRATQLLDDRCADLAADLEPEFSISPDARLTMRGGGMPGSPESAAWDLASGEKNAAIHPLIALGLFRLMAAHLPSCTISNATTRDQNN